MMSPSPLPVLKLVTLPDGSLQQAHSPAASQRLMLELDYDSVTGQMGHFTPSSLHEKLTATESLPEKFSSRLVGLHFGKTCLEMNDLTEFILHLEKRFYTFARSLPEFQALSADDQQALLLANSSMYVQLHLARYVSAGSGLRQIRALLAHHTPDVLAQCESSLINVPFSFFNRVVGLFGDRVWADFYESSARVLAGLDAVLSRQSGLQGEVAACILFYPQTQSAAGSSSDDYDSPSAVFQAWLRHARQLAGFCSVNQVKGAMGALRSLSHLYSAHANKHNKAGAGEAAGSSSSDQAELDWLRAQLSVLVSSCQDLCIGSEDLIQLGLAFAVDNNLPLAKSVCLGVMERRLELIQRVSASAEVVPAMETVRRARAARDLVLALFDACDSGCQQLDLVLGKADHKLWDEWFTDCQEGLFKKMVATEASAESLGLGAGLTAELLASRELLTMVLCLVLGPQNQRPLWRLVQDHCRHEFGEQRGDDVAREIVELVINVRRPALN